MIIYCLHIYKCTFSMKQLTYGIYYIYIHTTDTLRTWSQLTVKIDLIGQFIISHTPY